MKKKLKHCPCCIWNKICKGIQTTIGDEIPIHKLKVGMKVLAVSPSNKVKGVISQIQTISCGVYDGKYNWGFFLNEPMKASFYKCHY